MHTCCFIGHREISETEALTTQLYTMIERLIAEESIHTFLFGSKSRFDDLCYKLVTKLKEIYPYIKRIYVRAEFPVIENDYRAYLLEHYEDTYYASGALGAGKAVYVKRNQELIDRSDFCIFYYRDGYSPTDRKSGTKIALDYAAKHCKNILLLPIASTVNKA